MMNSVLFIGLMASSFLVVRTQKFMGPGKWTVVNIMKCEEDDNMLMKFDISQRKIDRSHDGFNAKIKLDEAIDDTYAVRVDICKFVDGGCKPYQVLLDNSFPNFCNKYSGSNVEAAFTQAKIDPPNFPLPAGEHEVKAFVYDYNQLPPDCPYGEYGVKNYILKGGLEKGCVYVHVKCYEEEDER